MFPARLPDRGQYSPSPVAWRQRVVRTLALIRCAGTEALRQRRIRLRVSGNIALLVLQFNAGLGLGVVPILSRILKAVCAIMQNGARAWGTMPAVARGRRQTTEITKGAATAGRLRFTLGIMTVSAAESCVCGGP